MNLELVSSLFSRFAHVNNNSQGYTSSAAVGLRDALLYDYGKIQIHSRILGNVIYLMASMTTTNNTIENIEGVFMEKLNALDR